jgi:hypothetical protein
MILCDENYKNIIIEYLLKEDRFPKKWIDKNLKD